PLAAAPWHCLRSQATSPVVPWLNPSSGDAYREGNGPAVPVGRHPETPDEEGPPPDRSVRCCAWHLLAGQCPGTTRGASRGTGAQRTTEVPAAPARNASPRAHRPPAPDADAGAQGRRPGSPTGLAALGASGVRPSPLLLGLARPPRRQLCGRGLVRRPVPGE